MSDGNSFIREDPWRIFRIMSEFVDSFQTMSQVGPAVTIFGSARMKPSDKYYRAAVAIAKGLAQHNLAIVTGGGPGIMEAANRGAFEMGAPTPGLNITLPHEQRANPYVTPSLSFKFHYFAIRKMHFMMRAKALVAFPGGFGTLDELFEVITLVQTQKAKPVPIILFGKDYWKRLINLDVLVEDGTISAKDLDLIQYTDDPEEAWQMIRKFYDLPEA